MLKVIVLGEEYFDEENQTFGTFGDVVIEMEHSLVSLSKWESMVKKPFLGRDAKTLEEIKLYAEAMIISPNYPPDIIDRFSQDNLDALNAYIESSESATTFGSMPEVKGRGETITSELIYYWMVAFTIPFECERWHLNRLFALIRICNLKNQKPKKMTRSALMERNRRINQERRAKHNTSG